MFMTSIITHSKHKVYYTDIYYFIHTHTVNADVDLVTDDDFDTSGELSVQVNCSHNYYNQSTIHLKISVMQYNYSTIVSCVEESKFKFDFLKCDTTYDLKVSWITTSEGDTSDSECSLNQVQNRNIGCPSKLTTVTIIAHYYNMITL